VRRPVAVVISLVFAIIGIVVGMKANGRHCSSSTECDNGQICIAKCATCSTGQCRATRVLP
jgi:hypothetical protein